ncbi:MAG: hypothetical protein JJT78_00490, partial [Leptospira sp.]|nr:hypothetical protein [Leptospira sp.]
MKIIKKNDRCVYLFLFLLFNFYLFIPNQVLGNGFPTKAEKSIELIGTWYFYPFQLYSGKDLNEISRKDSNIEHIELQEPLLVHIPSPWNKYKRGRMNEESFGSNGYGTFYSFLTDLIPGEKYALRLNYVASSHKIFVGDSNIPICKAGIVARNKEEYRPDYKHVLCSFTADSTSMRLAIQIANFHHVNGGFREAPIIGTFENLHKEYYTQVTSYGLVFALLFGAVLKLVIGLIGNDFNIRKLYIIGFIICPIIFLMGYEIRLGRELTDKIDFFFQVRSHMFVLPFCIGMLILFVSTWVISKKARFSAYLVSGILIALALFYAVGSFDLVIQFFLFNLKMTGLAFVFFIIYVFYVLLTNEEQIWVL